MTTFAKRYTAIHQRSSELSSAKLFRFAVVGSTKTTTALRFHQDDKAPGLVLQLRGLDAGLCL